MSPGELADQLRKARAALADPTSFYLSRASDWERAARQIVLDVMRLHRPEGIDEQLWAERAVDVADSVKLELVMGETVGVVLNLNFESAEQVGRVRGGVKPYQTEVPFSQIQEWVAAGRAGEPYGKRLDDRDAGKTDAAIAWRVLHALRRKKSEGLEKAIGEFLEAAGVNAVDSFEGAIELAWGEYFTARAQMEWQEYVRELLP